MSKWKIKKGTLLAACPDIDDPNFFQKVVLLCEHTSAGSFGLIINKPLEVDPNIDQELMKQLSHPNVHLMLGGPIKQGQMMLLHTNDSKKEEMLQIQDNIFLGGDLSFLQETLGDNTKEEKLLLCFGYIGWGFKELERQIEEKYWCAYPSSKELVFQTESTKIWQDVLKNIGGKYGSFSNFPEDLSSN